MELGGAWPEKETMMKTAIIVKNTAKMKSTLIKHYLGKRLSA